MDTAIKRLVSERLKAHAAGQHPDPELLAAFAEHTLRGEDREGLLNHLTACADCRDVLYMATPEAEAQQVLSPSSKPPRLAIRWATLAASIVILGGVLLTDRGVFTQHALRVKRSAEAPPQKIAESKAPPLREQTSETRAPAIEAGAKVLPPLKHMTAKPQASMQFDQSGQVLFTSQQPASGAKAAVVGAAASAKVMSHVDWGISANGDVQRSFDSGKTWQIVSVAGRPFRTVSSLGDDVWAGGNAGALYHSADAGQSWTRVEPISTDDIIQINFSDSQHGLLSTANRQVWTTSDGGRSWLSK